MTTAATATTPPARLNGVDTEALQQLVEQVKANSASGIARFAVTSSWKGGTRTDTRIEAWELGGRRIPRDFTISIDEPQELLGTNQFANPQEYLMAALNACVMATYVAACAVNGITLEHLDVQTTGELDLRGFLGISAAVKPGYDAIDMTVHIRGNGTREQFDQVHQWVQKTSPNYYNIASAVKIRPRLVAESRQ